MKKVKVLVAEDDIDILDLIHFHLFKAKYEVIQAHDGEEAFELIKKENPHICLLDIMMPKKDGLTLSKSIKENELTKNIGVILITAKGSEEDIVSGLESGADDYITKPFSPKILMARVHALSRRISDQVKASTDQIIEHQDIKISLEKHKAYLKNEELTLTFSEFELLKLFLKRPGLVYTRSQIVDKIRGENHAITDRSVDVHIVGLRKKLLHRGAHIETVRGVGYRWSEDS